MNFVFGVTEIKTEQTGQFCERHFGGLDRTTSV